jgi:hypothetical protein
VSARLAWRDPKAAATKARELLGPVWYARAVVVLESLALDAHPDRVAATARRRTIEAVAAAEPGPHRERLLGALPPAARAVRGPLDYSRANRRELVRVLARIRGPEDPPFPSATALAYFDVATGWAGPSAPGDAAGWGSRCAVWKAALQSVRVRGW